MSEVLFKVPDGVGEAILVAVQVPGCEDAQIAIPASPGLVASLHAAMDTGTGAFEVGQAVGEVIGSALADLWLAQGRGA